MLKKLLPLTLILFLLWGAGCTPVKKQSEVQNNNTALQQLPEEPSIEPEEPKPKPPQQPQPQQPKPQPKPQVKPVPKPGTTTAPKAVVNTPPPPPPATNVTSQQIAEVEKMVLALINQDRRKAGLSEVVWDETAANAARKHVQEEADVGYISHWGLDGFKPQLRYTRAGGLDAVSENESVTLWLEGGFRGVSKDELYKIVAEHESMMLNEKPPSDGHRKNILDKHHTGVGIAISVGKYGVAMAQEFTNHYSQLQLTSISGAQVNLKGRVFPGYDIEGIYAVWEQAPKAMSKEQLMKTSSYSDPSFNDLHFWAKPGGKDYYITTSKGNIFAKDLAVDKEGNFSLDVPLAGVAGLDYITLELAPKTNTNDRFYAGQLVVTIK